MIFLTKEELDRTEWLVDVDDKLKDYDRYWTELKQKVNKRNAVSKVEIAFFHSRRKSFEEEVTSV